jgi:5-methylthioadenosine/S-adenosylhomocysteine deaminase
MATVIRNTDWAVVWNTQAARHEYARGFDIAFDETGIIYAERHYTGPVTREIDGSNRLVLPGMINIHTHPTSEPLRKGMTDETLSPGFWHSSLYEFLATIGNDAQGMRAAVQVAMAELMLSGVTTVVDLSVPFEGWLDILAETGLRACIAPMFRDARWLTKDGHSLEYEWDHAAGRAAFDSAMRLVEIARQHPSGRLSGMVTPSQIDTCSADLLRDAHDHATERNLPFQIHCAQSMTEFQEMQRRHGMTPVQWLNYVGALDDRTIVGHGIFLDHHPWVHWPTANDVGLLADKGATVAHCPTVFAKRGINLRSFGDYQRAGINMGIGTDTYPHNFIEEMRNAVYLARAAAGRLDDTFASDVFDAATIGGARALRRDDIGRLCVGAKADVVVVDAAHPSMLPLYDPLRSLVYAAGERAIRDVFVDGELVVKHGECLTIDRQAASQALQEAQDRAAALTAERDWAGRSVQELAPLSFPMSGRASSATGHLDKD